MNQRRLRKVLSSLEIIISSRKTTVLNVSASFRLIVIAWLLGGAFASAQYNFYGVKKLQKLAERGDANAAKEIGFRCLDQGFKEGNICRQQDIPTAKVWLQKALDLGYHDAGAEDEVGNYLADPARGQYREALNWYRHSLQDGDPRSLDRIANLLSLHPELCEESGVNLNSIIQASADAGNVESMFRLGSVEMLGEGVPKDIPSANNWFEKVGRTSNKYDFSIGAIYLKAGFNERADEWFRKANQPQGGYEFAIGDLYLKAGLLDRAESWFGKDEQFVSGENSNTVASNEYMIGNSYFEAGYIDRALKYLLSAAQRPAWYSARKGYLMSDGPQSALQLLGEIYRDGKGVPPDQGFAQACFNAKQALIDQVNAQAQADEAQMAAAAARSRQANDAFILNSLGALGNAARSLNQPSPIQQAANQQVANIQAKQAQVQARQAVQQHPTQVASTNPPVSPAPARTPKSGTVPHTSCVNIGSVCTPIPPLFQPQAQNNQQSAKMQACPATGFVPGPGHYAACDAYVGERYFCTPGQMVPVNVPPAPPAGCGGTQTIGNGSVTPFAGSKEPTELACIQMSRNGQDMPVFHNACSFAVKYYYTPVNPRAGEYKEQNGILAPGETQTGYEGNGERVLYYACKDGDLVVGPDGAVITQAVNSFSCVKP